MLLMIDNYDSFTYNLVQYFGELGADIHVYRNDKISVEDIEQLNPERIVISPGPCTPKEAGVSVKVIRHFAGKLPLLGVCLGHQSLAYAFGGEIIRADRLMHGKTSMVSHDNQTIFAGLPNPFEATRYHSLIVNRETLPGDFEISAMTDAGEIMGLRHLPTGAEGVQFHPESILTKAGMDLEFSVAGRTGNSHCCIVDSPGFTAVPNIEANLSPVEGTANGVIVGDGSIPYYDIGVLDSPITFKVKDGFIYDISGGRQAQIISSLMAEQNDKFVYNIAQFAIGLNPLCTDLTGVMLNDEGVLGTIHIGIGTSSNLGGTTKATTHYDVIIRNPTVTFDEKPIMENGNLLLY